jgi:asparagine synthase (glutamine-hydrolysing)
MGYKVLISGTGADEVFAGYRRHQALRLEIYLKYTPTFLLEVGKFFVDRLKVKNSFVRRLKKIFINHASDKISRLVFYYSVLPLKRNKALFNSAFQKEVLSIDPSIYFKELLKNIPDEHSDLNLMLYWDMKTYLPNNNLNYTDKLGMAAGVEIRVPFLDIELVKFSANIPPELKMKGVTGKYLLRKLMEKYLPSEVIQRSKTGFGIPPSQLLAKDLKPKMREYLSEEAIQNRGIFNPEKVTDLLRDHEVGKLDGSYPIWTLLAIESWFRQFVDGDSSE